MLFFFSNSHFQTQRSDLGEAIQGIYLILLCALLELFELIVEHSELPSDTLYPCMQRPILAVLGVEIVFIPLTLLWRTDHCILPGKVRVRF